jgi:hypothetical protein
MSGKVTTADCKDAIAKAWPEIFGEDLADQKTKWKRVSKRGKKGEPIERVFFHASLPLQALVVETDGAISSTVIRGYAHFEADEEAEETSEAVEEMNARADENTQLPFFSKYPCFKPSDFRFQLCTQEQADESGETWYLLFPTRDFGRKVVSDSGDYQMDYFVLTFLPEDHGEATEGTFTSEGSIAETREQLVKAGFIEDTPDLDDASES